MDQPAQPRTKVPDLGSAAFLAALLAGLLLCASAASAESIDLRIADNGEVTAFGKTYASMSDYHRSAEFKNSDRRCIAASPLFTSLAATDCSLTSTTINPEYNPESGASFVIPVVYHVIKHTDGRGEISDALLASQIDVLNESFGAVSPTTGAGATNSKIQFVLATTDPSGAPTSGINRVTNDAYFNDADTGVAMKTALSWDPSRYLNMYTNTASGALGYATFPQESVGDPQDGVVLLWTSVGRNAPQGGVYDGGDTAVHEVGHWLGLEHTFNGGCGATPYTSGDLVGDTVAEAEPQYECTQAASTCGGGNNPIENFMDYTPDACMNLFSVEQVNRMRCTLINYRGALAEPAATADFSAARNEKTVRFTDRSAGADGASIATRSWDFGDGETSTETNPTHTYATFGTFSVTLTVTDDNGATGTRTIDVTLIAGETDPGGEGPSGEDGANLSGGCSSVPTPGGMLSMLLVVFGLAIRRRSRF